MKKVLKPLLLSILVLCIISIKAYAATSPSGHNSFALHVDSALLKKIISLNQNEIHRLRGHKLHFLQRIEWRILQRKIKKSVVNADEKNPKETVAFISLITGLLGLVLIFLIPILGFPLLLTAIITGIIGMNNNKDPKSRRNAIIGLIAGSLGLLLILLALAAFAGGFF